MNQRMILTSTSASWISSSKIWRLPFSLPFLPMFAIGSRLRKSFLWGSEIAQNLGICATVSEADHFKRSSVYACQSNSFFSAPCRTVAVHFCSLKVEVNSFTWGVSLSPFLFFFPSHETIGSSIQALWKDRRT